MYEYLITCQSEKSIAEIGVKLLVFFTFFINCFMKTLIKSITYCQIVPLECLLTYFVKIVCQASLPSFLIWVSLAIFCLDQWLMKIVCSAQHQSSLVGDNSLVHMNLDWWQLLNYMSKCKILCPTSCIEISLWRKPISNRW